MSITRTPKLYDTVKDKGGKRYRISKIDGSYVYLKGITADNRLVPGRSRKVRMDQISREYTLIEALAPVTVSYIKPAQPNLTKEEEVDDNTKKTEVGEEPETTSARKIKALTKTVDKLNEQIREDDAEFKRLCTIEAELLESKKTISKMRAKHEEDIAILKSELDMHKKAEQDLREINEEIGDEKERLQGQIQIAQNEIMQLRRSNNALTSIADSLAEAIHLIAYLTNAAKGVRGDERS